MSTGTLERDEVAAPIDPRIRARRIAVRRHQGRRRLVRLAEVGAVLAVVLAFLLAVRSPLLDVERVEVVGAERTEVAAVLAAAGIDRGEQLVDVDVAASAARVAALPWVDEVTVHRSLGGTITVELTERSPVALVRAEAGDLLVDATGAVLARAADVGFPDRDLVVVVPDQGAPLAAGTGPGSALPPAMAPALEVAERLAATVPGAVEEVRAGDDLVAVLAVGGEARFGDATQLEAKLLTLATVLGEVDLTDLERIDLRLPGNPVLTRTQP